MAACLGVLVGTLGSWACCLKAAAGTYASLRPSSEGRPGPRPKGKLSSSGAGAGSEGSTGLGTGTRRSSEGRRRLNFAAEGAT